MKNITAKKWLSSNKAIFFIISKIVVSHNHRILYLNLEDFIQGTE